MELHEHIKGEKERVTENPDAKKVLDNLENMPSSAFLVVHHNLPRFTANKPTLSS